VPEVALGQVVGADNEPEAVLWMRCSERFQGVEGVACAKSLGQTKGIHAKFFEELLALLRI
jgi:hypothetical protein